MICFINSIKVYAGIHCRNKNVMNSYTYYVAKNGWEVCYGSRCTYIFFLNQFSRHYGAISCVTHTAIEKITEEDAEKQ